jgi:hypothetical protein
MRRAYPIPVDPRAYHGFWRREEFAIVLSCALLPKSWFLKRLCALNTCNLSLQSQNLSSL